MNQLALGALFPYLFGLVLYLWRRGRASLRMLVGIPAAMAVCAIWAVAPDIPRILRLYSLYHRLARDPRCDIFFWHYTIDKIEGGDVPFHAVIVVMAFSLILAAWRELIQRETIS